MEAKKQPRLRTFEDVFHRIRWDDEYDLDAMTIGYDDRLLGAMEMPLHEFTPVAEGGDLPMHRIWYVRCGNRVLWDRRRKMDLVFGSGMTAKILAAGQGALTDEETAQRIDEAMANVQRVEEERQHNLEVKLHAQRHAEARRAGTLPCPSRAVKHSVDAERVAPGELCDTPARGKLILEAFRACDADGNGWLSTGEMRAFARWTGFDGSDEEWAEEYRLLCSEHGADEAVGIDVAVFRTLANDASDSGCHCTNEELQEIAVECAKMRLGLGCGEDDKENGRSGENEAAQAAKEPGVAGGVAGTAGADATLAPGERVRVAGLVGRTELNGMESTPSRGMGPRGVGGFS